MMRLPATVTLPTAPGMWPGDAYRTLGISRAVAHNRRAHHNFPAAGEDGRISTMALAAWLAAHGVRVMWL